MGNDANKKRKPGPYAISALFFLAVIGIGAFFINEISVFNEGFPLDLMTDLEYLVTFGLFLLAFLSYFCFGKKYFHYKEPWWLDILLFLFLLCGAVGIFLFPAETPFEKNDYVLVVGDMDMLRNFLSFFVSVLLMYTCFVLGPRCTRGNKVSLFAAAVLILLALAGIVYSLVCEWDVIASYFQPEGTLSSQVLKSFWNNRNTFGTLLLFAVASCALWNSHVPSLLWYFLILVFTFVEVFVLSKTSLILGLVVFAVYGLYRFIMTVRSRPVRNIAFLSTVLLGSVALILCIKTDVFSFLEPIPTYVRTLARSVKQFGTFDARIEIWETTLACLDTPIKVIFGLGYRNVNYVVGAFTYGRHDIFWTHNGIVDIIARSGIAGLILSTAILTYFLVCLFLQMRKENELSVTLLICALVLWVHGMTETTDFFLMDIKSISLVLLTFFPCLSDFYRAQTGIGKQERNYLDALSFPRKARYDIPPYRLGGILSFLLVVPATVLLGMAPAIRAHYGVSPFLIYPFLVTLLFAAFVLPYCVYAFLLLSKGKATLNILFSILFLALGVGLSFTPLHYGALLFPVLSLVYAFLRTHRLREAYGGPYFQKVFVPFFVYSLLASVFAFCLHFLLRFGGHSRYLVLLSALSTLFLFAFLFGGTRLGDLASYPFDKMLERFNTWNSLFMWKARMRIEQRRYEDSLPAYRRKEEHRRFKEEGTYIYPEMREKQGS